MSRLQEYVRAKTVEDAVERKASLGERAFYLAGGTDALVFQPEEPTTAIDVMSVDMGGVERDGESVVIGANMRLFELERSQEIQEIADGALIEAIRETGPWLIRNQATLTGNLCNASPSADSAPMLLALDTVLQLSDGQKVALDKFFQGPHRTTLDGQLVTGLRLVPAGRKGVFHKLSRSKSDIAQVNLAVAAHVNGQTLSAIRIAFGSVAPRPMRAKQAEALLEGTVVSDERIEQAVQTARAEISPIDDWRATAAYRRHAAGVMLQRALKRLLAGNLKEGQT